MFLHTLFWPFIFFCVACATICRVMAYRVRERDARGTGSTDTQLIQEIHRGLQRMEDRVEALETIIIDRAHHEPAHTEFE